MARSVSYKETGSEIESEGESSRKRITRAGDSAARSRARTFALSCSRQRLEPEAWRKNPEP